MTFPLDHYLFFGPLIVEQASTCFGWFVFGSVFSLNNWPVTGIEYYQNPFNEQTVRLRKCFVRKRGKGRRKISCCPSNSISDKDVS